MRYYSAIKRNKIKLFAATWMQAEIIILNEVSQKDKYHIISLLCGISYMAQMNLSIEQKQTNRLTYLENRLVVAKGEEREMDWEFGVSGYKLLHLEWISKEVLSHSIGNYIQSLSLSLTI